MSDIFQAELNTALEELQQHLQDLGTAKTQIAEAQGAASGVVSGMTDLSSNYKTHLEELTSKIEVYLKDAATRSKDFYNESATRVKQLQESYERKSQLMLGNLQSTQNQASKVHFEKSNEQLLNFLNSTNESIEAAITEMNKQITLINDMHNRQNGQVKEYMVRFERLMRAVSEVEGKISTINFPVLFEELDNTVTAADRNNRQMLTEIIDLKKYLRQELTSHTRKLESKIESQSTNIRIMQWLVVIMLLIVVGMGYFMYIS